MVSRRRVVSLWELLAEGPKLGAVVKQGGFLLFGVGFDLVQLDHRCDDGLHVSDPAVLRILLTEGLEALPQCA
jgi:hypothetical protein